MKCQSKERVADVEELNDHVKPVACPAVVLKYCIHPQYWLQQTPHRISDHQQYQVDDEQHEYLFAHSEHVGFVAHQLNLLERLQEALDLPENIDQVQKEHCVDCDLGDHTDVDQSHHEILVECSSKLLHVHGVDFKHALK